MIESAKLIIFDLDGTLYEGTEHFDYYAELLKQQLPTSKHRAFEHDYEQMKQGNHIIAVGTAYDVNRDYALKLDPMTLMVSDAYTWNGVKLSEDEIQEYYPEPLAFNFSTMIAIGDGWWLPFAAAKHYGVDDCYPSYLKTKEYMSSKQFSLPRMNGLRSFF